MTLKEKLREFIEFWEGYGEMSFTPSWVNHIKSLLDEVSE